MIVACREFVGECNAMLASRATSFEDFGIRFRAFRSDATNTTVWCNKSLFALEATTGCVVNAPHIINAREFLDAMQWRVQWADTLAVTSHKATEHMP